MSKNNDNQRQTMKDIWAGQARDRACDQGFRGRLYRPYGAVLVRGDVVAEGVA